MIYADGGELFINKTKDGVIEWDYKPSGKIVEKWRTLHSMGFLDDQVYYAKGNWNICTRLDFSKNSFDMIARNSQLNPGQSIMGWIFVEVEKDLRWQTPKIMEFELTLTNSAGHSQKFRLKDQPKKDGEIAIFLTAGTWHVIESPCDLSKGNYTLRPVNDYLQ